MVICGDFITSRRVWYNNTKYRLLTIIFCLLVLVRKMLVLYWREHIGNALTTPLGTTVRGQHVGGSWRWRTASGIDDDQHTPTATAAHTGGYGGGHHTELTARIMAGASAQRHGTRTAELLLISGRYY